MRNWMPGLVDHAHQPVQGVDLADQMALAQAADGRVAAHLADGLELVGEQQGARAEARRRRGGFAAGVAAADDDHVPICCGGETEVSVLSIAARSKPRCFT